MSAPSKPAAGSDGPAVPEKETRIVPLGEMTLRQSEKDGTLHLRGHAAVFGKLSHDLGGFREKIAKGAFAGVLNQDPDVHLVIGHDMNRVLARTRSKTLELREDPAGLHVWASLDPEDPDVRSLIPKMRRGDVDQMSFAFTVSRGGDEWLIEGEGDDERVIRTVREVDGLFDVSVVAQGAYPQTDASLRSLEAAKEEGRVTRTSEQHDDESAQVEDLDDAAVEQRTDAGATEPPDGDPEAESQRTPNEELDQLKAHARREVELAKRRLLAADRHGST